MIAQNQTIRDPIKANSYYFDRQIRTVWYSWKIAIASSPAAMPCRHSA
jgi:hypothetical protein